jgi:zinc resistance-associated protein
VAPRRLAVEQRPGYVLNDAQIISIKERLHLTPDQEQMWPAVESALRNIAYTHQQQMRGRSAPASTTQTAAVDPEAVQNLKSAAVPLIMSFNTEQKDEVRNLVHVMGLDQLASQF